MEQLPMTPDQRRPTHRRCHVCDDEWQPTTKSSPSRLNHASRGARRSAHPNATQYTQSPHHSASTCHARRPSSRGWGFQRCLCVCLFVCLFFYTISQKSMQLESPKLDTEMFRHESWKPSYFGVNRTKAKVTKNKNIAGVHGSWRS